MFHLGWLTHLHGEKRWTETLTVCHCSSDTPHKADTVPKQADMNNAILQNKTITVTRWKSHSMRSFWPRCVVVTDTVKSPVNRSLTRCQHLDSDTHWVWCQGQQWWTCAPRGMCVWICFWWISLDLFWTALHVKHVTVDCPQCLKSIKWMHSLNFFHNSVLKKSIIFCVLFSVKLNTDIVGPIIIFTSYI